MTDISTQTSRCEKRSNRLRNNNDTEKQTRQVYTLADTVADVEIEKGGTYRPNVAYCTIAKLELNDPIEIVASALIPTDQILPGKLGVTCDFIAC